MPENKLDFKSSPVPIHNGPTRQATTVSILIAAVAMVLIAGCSSDKPSLEKVIKVSSHQDSVALYFGVDDENYLDLTVSNAMIKSGHEIVSTDAGMADGLSASAAWAGAQYVSSSKHDTFAKLKILSLDNSAMAASISVSAKLVEPQSGNFVEFKEKTFDVTGSDYEELVRKANN